MPTRTHYLPKNENTEIPTAAIWVDTESLQEQVTPTEVHHRLWFGWACYARRLKAGKWSQPQWFRFDTAAAFWTWVDSKIRPSSRCYLFAHNTSFDLPILQCFHELPALGWTLKSAVIQAPPTILTFKKDTRTLKVLDTLNFWRMSLKQLGVMVNAPKMTMPTDPTDTVAWDVYCKNDVLVLYTACVTWWAWLKTEDLGGFAPTLASQAMRAYRHRFMHTPILIDGEGPATTLARAAYIGGRCECRRVGPVPGPIHVFDVNSLYPSVMHDGVFPIRRIGYRTKVMASDVERWLAQDGVVARVVLDTDKPWYPVVHRGFSVYPVGTFETVLCTPEFRRAWTSGHVRAVKEVAVYEMASIFTDYVRYMYEERLKAKEAGDTTRAGLFKLLLNSLYGKFGQTGHETLEREWIDDLSASCERVWDVDRQCRVTVMQLAGLYEIARDMGEGRDAMVAIAAHVTSAARMVLLTFIEQAGWSHVFYYDTDSLFVDGVGARRLSRYVDARHLGYLKSEGQHATATLFGPKDYLLGSTTRTKGVRASAVWLDDHTVEQDMWPSLKGQMRTGEVTTPKTLTVRKTLHRVYQKGRVTSRGYVHPLVFPLET